MKDNNINNLTASATNLLPTQDQLDELNTLHYNGIKPKSAAEADELLRYLYRPHLTADGLRAGNPSPRSGTPHQILERHHAVHVDSDLGNAVPIGVGDNAKQIETGSNFRTYATM